VEHLESRAKAAASWILKCLQGGRALPPAACGVALFSCSPHTLETVLQEPVGSWKAAVLSGAMLAKAAPARLDLELLAGCVEPLCCVALHRVLLKQRVRTHRRG
jgi:hypothetical protein